MSGLRQGFRPTRLAVILYPFVAATVAVNLFMLGLFGPYLGLPGLPPTVALLVALPLGVPFTWLAARWVRSLIDQAEGRR